MSHQVYGLKGMSAIVTGAGKGIGASIAKRLAAEGVAVVVADIIEERARRVVEGIGGDATTVPIQVDVSKRESVQALTSEALKRLGRIDILVNNAGIAYFDVPLEDLTEDQWRRVLGVNLDGPFFCIQAVLSHMKQRRGGRIINIGALGGKVGSATATADYAASKGGLLALTKYCARVLAQYRITVNAVVPGPIGGDTMAGAMTPDVVERAVRNVPLGRLGTPEDVANAVAFFASPAAEWITGEVMDVNGGFFID